MKHRDHLQYLQQYSSEHTVKGYKSTLRQFFNVIYGRSDNLNAPQIWIKHYWVK
jgi:hypothetical protein